jgi:predicted ATPase/transcriptional regulator with XRE-family HTH domain
MVKGASHQERDYDFGRRMFALRVAIGVSQAVLGDILRVSRHAVGGWETGITYPKAGHLKQLIALALDHHIWAAGSEVVEIHALWRAAHQNVLLDETWLASLLAPHGMRNRDDRQPKSGDPTSSPFRIPISTSRIPTERPSLPYQPTPFFGRETELREIARILADPACRLLTLLGPGGIGKTRLAVEVAARQVELFADGVVFVPLATAATPQQIVTAIGDALHLRFAGQSDPTASLLESLRARHNLLVLDNFEHLLEGADLVHAILQSARRISILATSRERLNLQSEWLLDVEGLTYPPDDPPPMSAGPGRADATTYSAVQLFLQRARQIQQTFPVTPATITTIVNICRHVAGMPLAIELAASNLRSVPLAEIERQILSSLDMLATTLRDMPPRHRSLRVVFDQSWSLLDEPERALFRQLAVFRGGCTVHAAVQVADATLPLLTTLVDKSLLRQDSVSTRQGAMEETRFDMLEPVHEYAFEKLAIHGEAETLRRRHATYYLALAEMVAARWEDPAANATVEQLDLEYNNMRAALEWARDSDHALGLQLATALTRFWHSRAYLSEGRVWMEELLAGEEMDPNPVEREIRARALRSAAWLAADRHDFAYAERLLEQSRSLDRNMQEKGDQTSLLLNAALQARAVGRYGRALPLLEEALARHRAAGDRGRLSDRGLGWSLYLLALVVREQGDFARATRLLEESVDLHHELGDGEGWAQCRLGLGDVARDLGDAAGVRKHTEESLAVYRAFGTQWALGFAFNNLAVAAYLEGDLPQALALVNDSAALFRRQRSDASLAEVLVTQGNILRAQGEEAAAYEALIEALRLAWVVGPRLVVVGALEGLAVVLAQRGQAEWAARLLGAAAVSRERMGTPVRPVDRSTLEQTRETARAALDAETFTSMWEAGSREPLEQSLDTIPSAAPFDALPLRAIDLTRSDETV